MPQKKLKDFRSPGQALKFFLDESHWTQEDLSFILSISPKHTNELVKDKKAISVEIARSLENAFNISAEDWLNISAKYQLEQNLDEEKHSLVKFRAEVSKYMPLNELIKKGWLSKFETKSELENQLKKFWGTSNKEGFNPSCLETKVSRLRYKHSDKYKNQFEQTNAVIWARMAENYAKKISAGSYDESGLKNLLSALHTYTTATNGVKKFITDLAEVGVKFIYLSHLSRTYLDGAAFKSATQPIVALTGRYDRIDNFWFTLSHELSHVLYHLKDENEESIFIDDSTDYGNSIEEKEANESAQSILLLDEILEFLQNHMNYLTVDKLYDCSHQLELHPAIIAGMLAHRGHISYSNLHRFNEPIRSKIPTKYKVEK